MALTSLSEAYRPNDITAGLFASGRYKPENPLRLRQINTGYTGTVQRVSDTVRRDRFVRSLTSDESISPQGTPATVPASSPAPETSNQTGFRLLRDVAAQIGTGTLRSGTLFGSTNPLAVTAVPFETVFTASDMPEAVETVRTTAAWYRQAGPLRLNQASVLPETALYTQSQTEDGTLNILDILAEPTSGRTINNQEEVTENLLYASTGSVLEQTPQLLQTLFA